MIRKTRNSKGFTLMEVILSISILVLVMGITYSALRQIIRVKSLLDDERDLRKVAMSVLVRMSREIQLTFDGLPLMPPKDNLTQKISPRIHLIGEQNRIGDRESGDSIRFLALEAGQYLPDGARHSGVVQIEYRVEKIPDSPPGETRYALVREETPYLRPYKKAYERTVLFPLTKKLRSLRFRYFDEQQKTWETEWGQGTKIRLPAMVEFHFELESDEGEIREFTTAVPLR